MHGRNDKRFGVTIYGAVGACMARPVYTFGSSTNRNEFQDFVVQVKAAIKVQYSTTKPFFLFDGHLAHTVPDSIKIISEHFIPIQTPAYSCEFNCKY